MQPVFKTTVLDIELDQIGRSLNFRLNIGELSSAGLKKWLHLVIYVIILQMMTGFLLGTRSTKRYDTGQGASLVAQW